MTEELNLFADVPEYAMNEYTKQPPSFSDATSQVLDDKMNELHPHSTWFAIYHPERDTTTEGSQETYLTEFFTVILGDRYIFAEFADSEIGRIYFPAYWCVVSGYDDHMTGSQKWINVEITKLHEAS